MGVVTVRLSHPQFQWYVTIVYQWKEVGAEEKILKKAPLSRAFFGKRQLVSSQLTSIVVIVN